MMMNVEQSVEWELAGETGVLREILSHWHFVHHKSHMTRARTRAAAVGSRRLTAWAMALPVELINQQYDSKCIHIGSRKKCYDSCGRREFL
jgi:hypothetical protein